MDTHQGTPSGLRVVHLLTALMLESLSGWLSHGLVSPVLITYGGYVRGKLKCPFCEKNIFERTLYINI